MHTINLFFTSHSSSWPELVGPLVGVLTKLNRNLTTPQTLQIYIARQEEEPEGWDDDKFGGPFPDGGTYTVKVRIPPTHKSWRNEDNFHTVTGVLAAGDNPHNHLKLGPKLERIVSHHCTCRSGTRTNSSCCHFTSLAMLLCGSALFRTAKVSEPRILDPEK